MGIAVQSITEAKPVLLALGCRTLIEVCVEGRFRWAQYAFGENASRLELITPEVENSFLTEFVADQCPGLHHVTLEVADIDSVIAAAEEAGLSAVEHAELEHWTEGYVSPANPTGTPVRVSRQLRRRTARRGGVVRRRPVAGQEKSIYFWGA